MKIEKDANGNYAKEMAVSVSELGDRMLRIIGSDETKDRSGDIVMADGWDVSNYLKNPVVLWAHDSGRPPIAKAMAVRVNKRDKRLEFDVKFPTIAELSSDPAQPSEHAKFVDTIYQMYKGGFLSAVSVGFRATKEPQAMPDDRWGSRFNGQELLELSLVPVPANPSALVTAKSAGINVESITKEVKMTTIEKAGARLSKSTREKLEAMYASHTKLAADLRSFLDEDMGEEEEGCVGAPKKGDGIEEVEGPNGGIEKPKAADVPVEKILDLGTLSLENIKPPLAGEDKEKE